MIKYIFHLNSIKLLLLLLILSNFSFSQSIQPPYFNNFDQPSDTIGWTHYAINGSDDWERGIPDDHPHNYAFSDPYVWATVLDDDCADNSHRVLQSPYFDLSNTSIDYTLSFENQREGGGPPPPSFYFEYSIDQGNNWIVLEDPSAQSENWQSATGFSINTGSGFDRSAIDLSFIQGQDSVQFRFRFNNSGTSSNNYGWMIDNFHIQEEVFNIYASPADTIFITPKCSDIEVKTALNLQTMYHEYITNHTHYFYSSDSIFDAQDSLIGTKGISTGYSNLNWNKSFSNFDNLDVGLHYIFYFHDANDSIDESNENDNIGYAVIKIDTILGLPYNESFENNNNSWTTFTEDPSDLDYWRKGQGNTHYNSGTHSGANAWHTGHKLYCETGVPCDDQFMYSPYLDLTNSTGTIVVNFWYQNHFYGAHSGILYSENCHPYWALLENLPFSRNGKWDYINLDVTNLNYNDNIQFKLGLYYNGRNYEGLVFDDFYIGPIKPDLSIRDDYDSKNLYTNSAQATDSIKYFLINAGLAPVPDTKTSFFWSNDSVLDPSDIFLGTKIEGGIPDTSREWRTFTYSKPVLSPGTYYIHYIIDSSEDVDEMREFDNHGYFKIYQEQLESFPYFNDFESHANYWRHNSSLGLDDWSWSTPSGNFLDTAFSGTKAWITNDTGWMSNMSRMHLYTPIFDFSNATNPVISFDMKNESPNINMSYSTDGGATWTVLDTSNTSHSRWYVKMDADVPGHHNFYYTANTSQRIFNGLENAFTLATEYHGINVVRNTKYINDISFLAGQPQVQFRFNISTYNRDTTVNFVKNEGALIDNFGIKESHIDLEVRHKKHLMLGSNAMYVHFNMKIKNSGNYQSEISTAKYYLSEDTQIDGNDYYLGDETVPHLRPDWSHYVTKSFLLLNQDITDYKYLIYELDASNTNVESDENNNIGHWPLSIDSLNYGDYFNNFNDTVLHGWYEFHENIYPWQNGDFRSTNLLAPAEYAASSADLRSGEFRTGNSIAPWSANDPPKQYIVSPTFDFSNFDSIRLSFDYMSIGYPDISNPDHYGGNLQFSIDGGNIWHVIDTSMGNAYNWYTHEEIYSIGDEPGWCHYPADWSVAELDSASIDLSSLAGEQNVIFRFKYSSKSSPYGIHNVRGFRLDNFKIESSDIDYVAQDSMESINYSQLQTSITIDYTAQNNGPLNGVLTRTDFYWSKDSILDSSDVLKHSHYLPAINNGDNLTSNIGFNAVIPLEQPVYYIFYTLDGADAIIERNENNNIGSYKLTYPDYPNFKANEFIDTIHLTNAQSQINLNYKIYNTGSIDANNSSTGFYWSNDPYFNVGDILLLSKNETPLNVDDSISETVSITYPQPITQNNYYIFFKSENDETQQEFDENDNTGYTVIVFDTILNSSENENKLFKIYSNERNYYINNSYPLTNNEFTIKILNSLGQRIYSFNTSISKGVNQFEMPTFLSDGVYYINAYNSEVNVSTKIVVLE